MTAPQPPVPATQRWKRALGRFLDSRGFTVDEWQMAQLGAHHESLVTAIQAILERLRLHETQTALLERDTLAEDWDPWLRERFGDETPILLEADPVAVAFGIRWSEILLDRQLDVASLLDHAPEALIEWTRDVP
jgi:hypothetical protein